MQSTNTMVQLLLIYKSRQHTKMERNVLETYSKLKTGLPVTCHGQLLCHFGLYRCYCLQIMGIRDRQTSVHSLSHNNNSLLTLPSAGMHSEDPSAGFQQRLTHNIFQHSIYTLYFLCKHLHSTTLTSSQVCLISDCQEFTLTLMKNVLASSQMRTDYTLARDNYTGPILIKASATVVTLFITPFIHYFLQKINTVTTTTTTLSS